MHLRRQPLIYAHHVTSVPTHVPSARPRCVPTHHHYQPRWWQPTMLNARCRHATSPVPPSPWYCYSPPATLPNDDGPSTDHDHQNTAATSTTINDHRHATSPNDYTRPYPPRTTPNLTMTPRIATDITLNTRRRLTTSPLTRAHPRGHYPLHSCTLRCIRRDAIIGKKPRMQGS